ncbi:helix-turn-helix domain-containing protein [Methylobacterium sp. SyP6R]|uniref:helix-turn-helix domain-containing protein n=1 Tax=Methylobacterium sp. SyP6R TaxID=2718876 RepID=UPI001F248F02|nr:helix-turn-helix transcriptional regulator [Methylobacterium sp. SyP6R]MCF4126312.1 helix-turn-helix domain-containing protein [Methylobacterium sp. SyP6R]
MSLAVIFGTNLRNCRKSRRLTQADLAEKTALSMEMISKIERGVASPSFSTIEKLAEILNFPESAFFGEGPIVSANGERARILSKIYTKLSRFNEDQLAKVDKIIDVAID